MAPGAAPIEEGSYFLTQDIGALAKVDGSQFSLESDPAGHPDKQIFEIIPLRGHADRYHIRTTGPDSKQVGYHGPGPYKGTAEGAAISGALDYQWIIRQTGRSDGAKPLVTITNAAHPGVGLGAPDPAVASPTTEWGLSKLDPYRLEEDKLQKQIDGLQKDITKLRIDNGKLDKQNKKLRSRNNACGGRVKTLTQELKDCEKARKAWKKGALRIKTKFRTLRTKYKDLYKDYQDERDEAKSLRDAVAQLRSAPPVVVAGGRCCCNPRCCC